MQYYNGLIDQYREKARPRRPDAEPWGSREVDRELSHEIHTVQGELKDMRAEIERLQAQLDHASPAFLLWLTLCWATTYPVCVRQGAAWGLHHTLANPALSGPTRERILTALGENLSGQENRDFRERRVQWLPGQGVGEWTATLRDGLRWVADLAQGDHRRDRAENPDPADVPSDEILTASVTLMCELMPGAVRFLTAYPLRLLGMDDHLHRLGEFLRDGCELTRWTQYAGQEWVGDVSQRYLRLVNRTTPNSIGLYYRLFRHPQLVLPILYHEFLHYGGPDGNPEHRIVNEAEVLLRETIFSRGLLARLAQDLPDGEVEAHERRILLTAATVGLDGTLANWVVDIESDESLPALNAEIMSHYGERLAGAELDDRVRGVIHEQNIGIDIDNATQALYWCPEKRWPYFGEPGVAVLEAEFTAILREKWDAEHHLTAANRDRVLNDPACRDARRAWDKYLRRSGARDGILGLYGLLHLSSEELFRRAIKRFEKFDRLDPPDDPPPELPR